MITFFHFLLTAFFLFDLFFLATTRFGWVTTWKEGINKAIAICPCCCDFPDISRNSYAYHLPFRITFVHIFTTYFGNGSNYRLETCGCLGTYYSYMSRINPIFPRSIKIRYKSAYVKKNILNCKTLNLLIFFNYVLGVTLHS